MYRFRKAQERWWNKPLTISLDFPIPAEIAILRDQIKTGEEGVWMNSRGIKSGVERVEKYIQEETFRLKTIRLNLPVFVSETISKIYETTGLKKGCPDLIIWNNTSQIIRFIEVKCPHWDKPSDEQDKFLQEIKDNGMSAEIIEWEFIET